MLPLLLAATLAGPALAAAKPAASADDKKLVDYFIKTPTGTLDPALIPRFMALDLSTFDPKRRDDAQAKRLELDALRRVAESKNKPPIRRAGLDPIKSCDYKEGDARYFQMLQGMGFMEIYPDEEQMLEQKTKCSECELQLEFTLTRVVVKGDPKRKRPPEKHLLLHGKDPLMALVSQYRSGRGNGTDFFGTGFFGACH